jgi:hypothetical protein
VPNEPVYDDAEVEEILKRALDRGGNVDGLSHAELAEVAAEVGLSPEELEHAARSVLASRAERRDRDDAARVLAERKRSRRRGLAQHAATWGVIGAGLAALDYFTGTPGISWALFPIIGWGTAVGLHGVGLAFRDDDKELRAIARQLRKQRERAAREAERQKERPVPKIVTAEAALEAALEKGIALLLTKVADKLEAAAAPRPSPRDTELNRFIAQKKGDPVRVEPTRPGAPRTRVEPAAKDDEVEVPRSTRRAREREV